MKFIVAVLVLMCGQQVALAGRAFPIEAENFATRLFLSVNPRLEWDPTNFLVDLSGQYALCKNIGQRGPIRVARNTPEGATIGGLIDSAVGSGTTADTVVKYIEATLPSWLSDSAFTTQINKAERFGCSVQPGCSGRASIACLFSPEYSSGGGGGGGNIQNPPGGQKALAFTRQQYVDAELLTGVGWDRSNFLENLSGFETDCAMVERSQWFFANAKGKAAEEGINVEGQYSSSLNLGSTERALEKILSSWKTDKFAGRPNTKLGCSVIPDCIIDSQMWVVVSCLIGTPFSPDIPWPGSNAL